MRGWEVKFWPDRKKSESGSATVVVTFAEGKYTGLGGAKNLDAFEAGARRLVQKHPRAEGSQSNGHDDPSK